MIQHCIIICAHLRSPHQRLTGLFPLFAFPTPPMLPSPTLSLAPVSLVVVLYCLPISPRVHSALLKHVSQSLVGRTVRTFQL